MLNNKQKRDYPGDLFESLGIKRLEVAGKKINNIGRRGGGKSTLGRLDILIYHVGGSI